jgi:hypothetical protein
MAARSIDDLLKDARTAIDAGETHLHQAAENIAAASERGATQRKIADVVGKSAAWVNGLLKWRLAGYPATAFGPQRAASRATFRQSEQNAERKPATDGEQARAQTARAQADKAKAEAATAKAKAAEAKAKAQKAKEDAAKARANAKKAKADRDKAFAGAFGDHNKKATIDKGSRERLVKFLGMLGSDHVGERDNAAVKAETLRKKVNLSWDQLILESA